MKKTVPYIVNLKNNENISMVTAYDYPSAKAASEADIDVILIGDSLAQVVLGHEDTLSVTVEEILHHVKAVSNAKPNSLVVADMPYMSYHIGVEDTLRNAAKFIQIGKADAVKVEGGSKRKETIEALVNAEIPVMGHLGLTPQSIYKFGTYTVRAKEKSESEMLIKDAKLLDKLGCFGIILEKIPAKISKKVTSSVKCPVVGIGAGSNVDGQVIVTHDLIGLSSEFNPRFLRRYADVGKIMTNAIKNYIKDIKSLDFPNKDEQY